MGVPLGTVTDTPAAVAVQPMTLLGTGAPVQPDGSEVTDRLTRSKKVALRATVIGTVPVVPASTVATVDEPGLRANVPRLPIFDTSSSGSCVGVGVGRGLPVQVAQVAERLADLGRRRVRAARLVERDRAGDRRGRHRGAGHVRVAGAWDRRQDAFARGHDVDVGAVVAEVGERVVLVVAAPREAAIAPEAARLAVRVGEGRDGDDLVVAGRDVARRVVAVVGGRGDDRDAAGGDAADGLVERIVVGQAAVVVVRAVLGDATC